MDVKTAQCSIDFMYDHSKDAKEVSITFYGGEPLLNFKLIESVVTYANIKFEAKKVLYNITTNASLLNDNIIAFLVKNNFSVLISLDGEEKIQNYHRKFRRDGSDSFNVVWKNVMNIREKYPNFFRNNIRFNAVMLPDENPEVVREFFYKNGILTDSISITKADMSGVDYKITHHDNGQTLDIISSVFFENEYKDLKEKMSKYHIITPKWHHDGPCVPGVRRLFVGVDGFFYPCEKVNKAVACRIGSLSTGIDTSVVARILNVGNITEKECKNCWAIRFCSICVKQCIDDNEITYEKKIESCKWVRINALKFLRQYALNRIGG